MYNQGHGQPFSHYEMVINQAVNPPKERRTAEIVPIFSISEIDIGNEANLDDCLVVFDIDDVLTVLDDPAFQRPNFKAHHSDSFKAVMAPLNKVEQALAFTMPLLTTPSKLIETDAPEFISSLQKRAKTIALTAAMGIEIDGESIEDRRGAELKRVGIDFSISFPEIPETAFPGFNPPVLGRDPLFKNGIILTNENDKGKVLEQFLKTISWKPRLICFVDDRKEHVTAVLESLKIHFPEICVRGYHFQPDRVPYSSAKQEDFKAKWEEVAQKAKELIVNNRYFPRAAEGSSSY
jgi:uncharacterized protein DUF2608